MKFMMIFSALLITTSVFAEAGKCDLKLTLNRGWGYMTEKQEAKTIELIQERGYVITKDSTAPFKLEVIRYFGHECGTGLSRWDEYFNVPAGYVIDLDGPGVSVKAEEWFDGIGKVVDLKSFNKLKGEIQNLPKCHL